LKKKSVCWFFLILVVVLSVQAETSTNLPPKQPAVQSTCFNVSAYGTIVKSLATEGGAVIRAMSPGKDALYGGFSAVHGLEFAQAHHASRIGRVCAQRCTYSVAVTGAHGFSIQQLDIERVGPKQSDTNNEWQTTISDVHDPKNLGVADINYWVVIGNIGAVNEFSKNGGASIQARRIGTPAK